MYSVVLMMALGSGAEVPAFGGRLYDVASTVIYGPVDLAHPAPASPAEPGSGFSLAF